MPFFSYQWLLSWWNGIEGRKQSTDLRADGLRNRDYNCSSAERDGEFVDIKYIGCGKSKVYSQLTEHNEVPGTQTGHSSNIKRYRTVRLERIVVVLLVSSIVILVFSLAETLTCNNSFLGCYPQLLLEIKAKSLESKMLLSSIGEGLKLMSYFAKDFSITLNGSNSLVREIDDFDVIDTFSDSNIYKFNVGGYCRLNKKTKTQKCSYSNGIDIFSSLIRDIGSQLGVVSKSSSSKEISKSFAVAFSQALDSLNELYLQEKQKSSDGNALNIDSLALVHKIKLVEKFGVVMKISSIVSLMLSALIMIFHFVILISYYQHKHSIEDQLRTYFRSVLIFQLINFTACSIIMSGELVFYNMLTELFDEIDIAEIKISTGFYLLGMKLCSIMLHSLLVLLTFSKWIYL
ncbi:uncharacterized protein PRCAT00002719001 [Priceomyces carsonii]|uniref:uncharacterized protein n=1 Tax=Priceomyces carsonii TaxID=28549 RepID=UPI002ED92165|nr:unnamed protein product [Priceomyces carsonii]